MRKKVLSVILVLALSLSVFGNTGMAYDGEKGGKNKGNEIPNEVLYADNASVNGTKYDSPEKTVSKEKVRNNLLGWLSPETELKDSLYVGAENYLVDKETYISGSASLSGTTITVDKPFVAKGDVTVSAANVIIKDTGFLLSVTGNINIYCTNLTVNGPVCADKQVFITGSKADVNEVVVADKIEIYIGTYQTDNSVDDKIVKGLQNRTAELSMYEEDGKNHLFGNANFLFSSMDIYGRKSGEGQFSLIAENITEDAEILSSWNNYEDFAAVMKDSFGYTLKSEPLSVIEDNGMLYAAYGNDSDSDGVTDAYEIWLSETNPYVPDVFPDPDYYVYYANDEGITCYDRLLQRDVFYSNEDYVKTYEYDDLNRVSHVEVCYQDGSRKKIRYEYEDDHLKNLYVGDNKYSISEDDSNVRYLINGSVVKQISKSEKEDTVSYFDTLNEVYRYDEKDNLISYRNQSLYEMSYDDLDLLASVSKNGSVYVSYTYDDYGNYVTIDATDYSIHYTYDYPLYQADYSFDGLQKTQKVNCKDDAYAYGDSLLLTDGTIGQSVPQNKKGEILVSDANARVLKYSVGEEIHTIHFNARGYVIRDSWTVSGAEIVNDYTYDSYGNLTQTKTRQNGQEYVKSYAYGTAWSDVLTSFDGKNITYDTLGKPKKYYNGLELTWATGKLSEVNSDGVQACYRYGYDGLREEKIVNGLSIEFIYEGHDLIAELSDDSIYYTYDGNFNLVGFEWNGKRYYYQYSIFGDVIGILNENGKTLCSYSYDIWGALLSVTGDSALATRNPIRYRGYYYDNETGLYYLESRYYDPNTKRFISYDDLESFFYGEEESIESLFVYCRNNPIVFCDENGRISFFNQVWVPRDFNDNGARVLVSNINQMLRNKYGSATITNTTICEINNKSQFMNAWAGLGANKILVIRGHSNATNCSCVTLQDINGLARKNIEFLFITGCNCGHYDVYNNVARAFTKKVSGCVIASDGEVLSKVDGNMYFKPIGGDAFVWYRNTYNPTSTRSNYGWIKYRQNYGTSILGFTRAWYTVFDIFRAAGV